MWKGKDVATSNDNNMINASKTMDDNSFNSGSSIMPRSSTNTVKPSVPEIPVKDLSYKETTDGIIITNYNKPKIEYALKPIFKNNCYEYVIYAKDVIKGNVSNIVFYTSKPKLKDLTGDKISDSLYKYTLKINFVQGSANGSDLIAMVFPKGGGDGWTIGYAGKYGEKLHSEKIEIDIPKNEFVDKDMILQGYKESKLLKIPDVINGKPVVGIGDDAFYSKYIDGIVLPNKLKFIGKNAFRENMISTINLPNTLKDIDTRAFSNNYLTTIEIPDGVQTIGLYAFSYNELESVSIPNSVTTIKTSEYQPTFGNRDAKRDILNVTMPEKFKNIKSNLFYSFNDIKFNLI